MEETRMTRRWHMAAVALSIGMASPAHVPAAHAQVSPPDTQAAKQEAARLNQMPAVPPHETKGIDHSGRKEKGHVSYYGKGFAHKKMADGRPMNPESNVAASKTLPLGTTAKVTNLSNGKSATVKVEDRGPYVKGRVVDVSPKVADQLDLKHKGVAPVEVKPITVPQPDGAVKLGAGAADATPQEIQQAKEVTKQLTGQTEAVEK